MDDIPADTNKDDASRGKVPSAVPTEGEVKKDEAVDKDRPPADANKDAAAAVKPWMVKRAIIRSWEFVKSPNFTNPAIAVATIVIAAMAILQWREMVGSGEQTDRLIETARQIQCALESSVQQAAISMQKTVDNFREAQRPYLWVSGTGEMGVVPNGEHTGQFNWNISIKNFGKTPAVDARFDIFLEVGKDAYKKVRKLTSPVARKGVILPPDVIHYITGYSVTKPTKAEIDEFLSIEKGVVVYGRIDYTDSYGVPYWSLFCESRAFNGPIEECNGYTQIK